MTSRALQWLRRLRRLTGSEVRLLIEAQLRLLQFQVARWVVPTARLIGAAPEHKGPQPGDGEMEVEVAEAVGWAVTRASRYGLFRPRCLVRSLALRRMLVRRGIHSGSLRIGVRRTDGGLAAHAWIEVGDRVVGDSLEHVRLFTPTKALRHEGL